MGTGASEKENKRADEHSDPPWWMHGLSSGAAVAVISLTVAFTISLISYLGFGPVRAFEDWSRDFTFRTTVVLAGPVSESMTGSDELTGIVFIDIDYAACDKIMGPDNRCRVDGLSRLPLHQLLSDGLRSSGAKAVVVDMHPPKELAQALNDSGTLVETDLWSGYSVPVVMAMPGAMDSDGRFVRDDAAVAAFSDDLQFAPPIISHSGFSGKGDLNFQDRVVRTAIADIDTLIEDRAQDRRFDVLPIAIARTLGQDFKRENGFTIFYTLPSASYWSDPFGDKFERRPLSEMIVQDPNSSRLALNTDGLADQIVIIGSSELAALDIHSTPLGSMAGPEIIANIVRGIEHFPDKPKISFWDVLWWKFVTILPALLTVIGAELATSFVNSSKRSADWTWRRRFWWKSMIWTLAIIGSIGFSFYFAMSGLLRTGDFAVGGDILLPLAALFLEEFVRVMNRIIVFVESSVTGVLMQLNR